MKQDSRATRVAFRRAVWASVALHAAVVCGLFALVKSLEKREQMGTAAIDTRAADEAQVRISLTVDAPDFVAEPAPTSPKVEQDTSSAELAKPQAAPSSVPLAASRAIPHTLPSELIALIRKPTTGGANVAISDPNVRPAAATGTTSAPAIHGALAPGKTVVYVLDCSGSMGAAGKFDTARAALVATLAQQPATVRFQVIVYAGTAYPLLATDGNALPATGANVRAAAEKLAGLEPRGKSEHFGAVRAALAFQPDVILLLTDADDLTAAALRPVLASAAKAVPLRLGQVTAEGVRTPQELK